jgi:hypothetical protein
MMVEYSERIYFDLDYIANTTTIAIVANDLIVFLSIRTKTQLEYFRRLAAKLD